MREPAAKEISARTPGREVGPGVILIALALGTLQAVFTLRLGGRVQWTGISGLWVLWFICGVMLWRGPREWAEPRTTWKPQWCRFTGILLFVLSVPFFYLAFRRWNEWQHVPAAAVPLRALVMAGSLPITLLALGLLLLLSGRYLMQCAQWLRKADPPT